LALLHRPQPGFNPFAELLAAVAGNALHQLFNPAIGPDAEADGVLSHPDNGSGRMLAA
jgi:hypothetical protein